MPTEVALKVPPDVEKVTARLLEAGHDAYVVGGSVRDALRGVDPHDWDVTNHATPEEIQKVFQRALYNNRLSTVVPQSGEHEGEGTNLPNEAGHSRQRRPGTGR